MLFEPSVIFRRDRGLVEGMSQKDVGSVSVDAAVASLDLEQVEPGRLRGRNNPTTTGVVHAGQLMGQMLVAAARTMPGKQVKSIHSVLARMVKPDLPNDLVVDVAHEGRVFGSASVDLKQGEKVAARSLVLFHAEEPDLIHHGSRMPSVAAPEDCLDLNHDGSVPGEVRPLPGQDVMDPEVVGEPTYGLWFRCPEAPDDPILQQALLIPASVMYLIGAAVRPHRGLGLSMAHRTIDTGVITHSMTYHRPVSLGQWLLYTAESPFAGGGVSYGRGEVFTRDGELVASFQQENLIRQMQDWSRKS
jgi:acyl-CoA thioesterase II